MRRISVHICHSVFPITSLQHMCIQSSRQGVPNGYHHQAEIRSLIMTVETAIKMEVLKHEPIRCFYYHMGFSRLFLHIRCRHERKSSLSRAESKATLLY